MGQGRSVLLVDDEPDFLEILSVKFKSVGFEVRTASNGEEAIKSAREAKPDLILLDMKMPGMSGADVLLALREDPGFKDTIIVFLSSYGDPRPESYEINKRFSKEIGANDYFKKTDDLEELVSRVHALLP